MTTSANKKHSCPDCKQCQHCSDARCNLCRGQKDRREARFATLSMAEQIRLYDELNRKSQSPAP